MFSCPIVVFPSSVFVGKRFVGVLSRSLSLSTCTALQVAALRWWCSVPLGWPLLWGITDFFLNQSGGGTEWYMSECNRLWILLLFKAYCACVIFFTLFFFLMLLMAFLDQWIGVWESCLRNNKAACVLDVIPCKFGTCFVCSFVNSCK